MVDFDKLRAPFPPAKIEWRVGSTNQAKTRGMAKEILKLESALWTFVEVDGIEPTNNTAERAIQLQVVMRKIFGGSRSLAGAQAHQVNSSVVETLRRQNPDANFFEVILPLLTKRHSGL